MLSYILYGLIWLVSFLPLWLLYLLSDVLYYIIYYVVRYRREVVWVNLRNSFPEKMKLNCGESSGAFTAICVIFS